MLWGIIWLVTVLAGSICALHALYNARSAQGALAWTIALLLLPLPSIIFYLALGRRRLRRLMSSALPEESTQSLVQLWQQHKGNPNRLETALSRLTGIDACSGNEVQLLLNGEETYRSLLTAMEAAQESILLEFFIIKDDKVGKLLGDCLMRKAQQGVRVHVIYDEIGSHKLPLGLIRKLQRAGVHISPFLGKRFWLSSFLRINHRNHRKLVIVDSQQAWLGGLNIGCEYLGKVDGMRWRDTFISIKGPVAAQAMLCFHRDWYRATQQDLHALTPKYIEPHGTQQAMCIPSGPEYSINAWQSSFLLLASQAQHRLWIATPYLIPSESVLQALYNAALRGVDVRIIVPERGSNIIFSLARLNYIPELCKLGIKILGYQAGFLHQKVLLCDDNFSCIGSANLDNRSLSLNYELNCIIHDQHMAQQVESMLREDMLHCSPITEELWEKSSLLTRYAARLCRLLAPVL